jgi:acetoin utilization deacetylase AcuC-like enzyme
LTGFVYDAECLEHDNGSMILDPRARDWIPVLHPEGPQRIARTYEVLEQSGRLALLEPLACPLAGGDALGLVHPPDLVAQIEKACARGEVVWVGPEARVGPGSWRPALKAAGGAIAAVNAVMTGQVGNAYALVRPPGHHASATVPMGFCIFNNIAIGCRHAQARHGVEKVAIVDWDVHHGNGTQAIFYESPEVLFISLHQDDLYPKDSGRLHEVGSGRGNGFNVNIPMPAGSGDLGYALAFEQLVEPVIVEFAPDLIMVSAGQDASAADPLGRMSVTTEGFRNMASRVRTLAQDMCGGRMIAVQEGGYSQDHMPYCTLAVIEAMAGLEPSLAGDPLELDVPAQLQETEVQAVSGAREFHSAHWRI